MTKTVSKFTCDALIVRPSGIATTANPKPARRASTKDAESRSHPGMVKNTVTAPYPNGRPAPADLNEIHQKFWNL